MTLNQLSYFYQAAVLEHFNQAAEKMNITEPSLSRSIAALEDELGVTLFEKRGRNVILTKAGEIFLEHVSTILDDVKRAENKMHQIATDGGHIDIAYVSPLAKVFIPTIVRSFLTEKENKNITFNFFQDITSVNIEGLKKGRYDIIFGSYSPDENGIDFVPIIRQEIVAILPPGHPLTLKDTMEATDSLTILCSAMPDTQALASTPEAFSRSMMYRQTSYVSHPMRTASPPSWRRALALRLSQMSMQFTAMTSAYATSYRMSHSHTLYTWAT